MCDIMGCGPNTRFPEYDDRQPCCYVSANFVNLAGHGQQRDWVASQMTQLEVDGDIDTLMTRIAHIRTWTYITHRTSWTDDPENWQDLARSIEDRLSDELHNRLTQRFVDRRAAHLSRRLKELTH